MQEIKVERTHLFAPNISVIMKVEIRGNPSDAEFKTAIKKSAESSEALYQKIVISQDGRVYFSDGLEKHQTTQELKENAWRNVDHCGNCGSCGGGRYKNIFGKVFNDVCGCTFRIDNPNSEDLFFLKEMVNVRMKEFKF